MRYEVAVVLKKTDVVVVEAGSEAEAVTLAVEVAELRNPGLSYATYDGPTRAADDARLATYKCFHCGRQAAKEAWGPGRITCPHCGTQALTAEEALAEEARAMDEESDQEALAEEARVRDEESDLGT